MPKRAVCILFGSRCITTALSAISCHCIVSDGIYKTTLPIGRVDIYIDVDAQNFVHLCIFGIAGDQAFDGDFARTVQHQKDAAGKKQAVEFVAAWSCVADLE